ncbi:MAG: DoxX family protein [Firmicutes bacterium]|nr:DoxX family protein [Bacillota bacterium]
MRDKTVRLRYSEKGEESRRTAPKIFAQILPCEKEWMLVNIRASGPIILRIVMGLFFIGHAVLKYTAFHRTVMELVHAGVPLPDVMTVLVGIFEAGAGILLVINRGVRWISVLLLLETVAIFFMHGIKIGFDLGWGWDILMAAALWEIFVQTFDQSAHAVRHKSPPS